jgi:hypothetical protein
MEESTTGSLTRPRIAEPTGDVEPQSSTREGLDEKGLPEKATIENIDFPRSTFIHWKIVPKVPSGVKRASFRVLGPSWHRRQARRNRFRSKVSSEDELESSDDENETFLSVDAVTAFKILGSRPRNLDTGLRKGQGEHYVFTHYGFKPTQPIRGNIRSAFPRVKRRGMGTSPAAPPAPSFKLKTEETRKAEKPTPDSMSLATLKRLVTFRDLTDAAWDFHVARIRREYVHDPSVPHSMKGGQQ